EVLLNTIEVSRWELTLGSTVNNCCIEEDALSQLLDNDPGIEVIKDLIFEFRASAVMSALKMTCRFIKTNIGSEKFDRLLRDFCSVNESEIFGYSNAERFSRYLQQINLPIPNLDDMLRFEIASLNTTMDGIKRFVDFSYNPFPVFASLANYQRPNIPLEPGPTYRLEIVPDEDFKQENSNLSKINTIYHD
ncbi:MAG TPA: hypothetical protein VFE53_07315, partial [Mucilaginibacter sp.]|nr:hypothetical protein [Mucilaginibacter sp.]